MACPRGGFFKTHTWTPVVEYDKKGDMKVCKGKRECLRCDEEQHRVFGIWVVVRKGQ